MYLLQDLVTFQLIFHHRVTKSRKRKKCETTFGRKAVFAFEGLIVQSEDSLIQLLY